LERNKKRNIRARNWRSWFCSYISRCWKKTNEIIFTLDDGDHWKTCQFSDTLYQVTNIRVSQGWDSRKFVLHGERDGAVVIAQIDFENAYSGGKCSQDDFDEWSPTDKNGYCVLGKKLIYQKRKQGKECWFGESHSHVTISKNCSCTENDFECDHCFIYDEQTKKCVFFCTKEQDEIKKLDIDIYSSCDKGYRNVTKGYKIIDNDTCDATFFVRPKGLVSCAVRPSSTILDIITQNATASIIIGIALVLVISLLTGFCLYKNHSGFHNFIKYTFNIGEDVEIDYTNLRISDVEIDSD